MIPPTYDPGTFGGEDPTVPRLQRRRNPVDSLAGAWPDPMPAPAATPFPSAPTPPARPAATAAPARRMLRPGSFQAAGAGGALVRAAAPLLDLLVTLRSLAQEPDPEALQREVEAELRAFEERALGARISGELVMSARYALCCAIDEAVLRTTWGGDGGWSTRSLLVIFHNETWGGERFFQILDVLRQQPSKNADAVELFAILLALGFEGRYGVQKDGAFALDALRHDLYRLLRPLRGESRGDLSARWRPAPAPRAMSAYLPGWTIGAVAGLALILVFVAFSWQIDDRRDLVLDQAAAIGRTVPPPPTR